MSDKVVKRGKKPTVDIIVDVETIGIFRPGNYATQKEKVAISSLVEGKTISKEQQIQIEKKMIISKAVFNVGITVQHNGEIQEQHQVGIDEFWLYPEHRILDFYRKNFDKDGGDFTVRYETFGDFLTQMFYPLLKKFKEEGKKIRVSSYNAAFDSAAFVETSKLEGIEIPTIILENWKCILVLACNCLLQDEGRKFYNWIVKEEHRLLSQPKKEWGQYISFGNNARVKAETVYRYITKDTSFIETHKGLQDTEIEGKIFEWCRKHKGWKNMNASPTGGAWQVLNCKALPFKKIGTFDNKCVVDLLSPINQEKLEEIMKARGEING